MTLDPAVRRDEPDSVHQMRVTTRRLRSTFQSFPTVLPEPDTRQLRDDLKWLGGLLVVVAVKLGLDSRDAQ